MKFVYEYRTPDNIRREGLIDAVSREAAFGELRSQGIRPARVSEAPGLANKVLGKGKRWIAIAFLGLLCVGMGAYILFPEVYSGAPQKRYLAPAMPRHQVYGDPVRVKMLSLESELSKVFTNRGDLVLASFAQPGRRVRLEDESVKACSSALEDAVAVDLQITDCEPVEIRELKQIVNGMKAELREYVAHEGFTVQSYYRCLMDRSRREVRISERVRRELQGETDISVWESKNAQLRRIGLRPLDIPDELFD